MCRGKYTSQKRRAFDFNGHTDTLEMSVIQTSVPALLSYSIWRTNTNVLYAHHILSMSAVYALCAAFWHQTEVRQYEWTIRFGPLLQDIEYFDCQSFGLSPKEATLMDPQQRKLLMVAHESYGQVNARFFYCRTRS